MDHAVRLRSGLYHPLQRLSHLYGFLRDLYQMTGIAESVSLPHIRNRSYRGPAPIDLHGIITIGPAQDLDEPHGRVQRLR